MINTSHLVDFRPREVQILTLLRGRVGPLKQTKHPRIGGFTCLEGSGRLNGPRLGWAGLAGWLAGWLAEVWKFGCLDLRTEAGLAGWLAGSLARWLAEVWMFGGILILGCLDVWRSWDVWRCLLIYILFFFGCLEVWFNIRSPPRSTTMGRRIIQ